MKGIAVALLVLLSFSANAESNKRKEHLLWLMTTDGFMTYHPDLRWRRDGLLAYRRNDFPDALWKLKKAASFGDKPSQAMVADMYWRGIGVPQDRAMGYAWIDLAAERLYPDMVSFRERYWAELGEQERQDAVAKGRDVYAEYGDAVAKPRQAVYLRRGLRKATGSRTGFTASLGIELRGEQSFSMTGHDYYAAEFWQPQHHWALQNEIWKAPVRERVRVGEPEQVRAPASRREEKD